VEDPRLYLSPQAIRDAVIEHQLMTVALLFRP
jgi:hypothetical protein